MHYNKSNVQLDINKKEDTMETTLDQNTRNWGMFCHLAALAFVLGVPFGNVLGPLVVWLIKRNEIPYVDEQGKEALNFQISVAIYAIVCIPLVFIAIGIFLLFAIAIADLILIIVASIKVSNGEPFKYPATIRFIK